MDLSVSPMTCRLSLKLEACAIEKCCNLWLYNHSLNSELVIYSKTRIRHCSPVSRVGDVSDTDTPGIRLGYVSAACPRIPGSVGRKLKNGDVSARSIRPSSPVASFRDLLPSPDLTQSPSPHARAKGPDGIGSSPSPAPPRAAVLLPVALRLASPFASQIDAAAPASPFAS